MCWIKAVHVLIERQLAYQPSHSADALMSGLFACTCTNRKQIYQLPSFTWWVGRKKLARMLRSRPRLCYAASLNEETGPNDVWKNRSPSKTANNEGVQNLHFTSSRGPSGKYFTCPCK